MYAHRLGYGKNVMCIYFCSKQGHSPTGHTEQSSLSILPRPHRAMANWEDGQGGWQDDKEDDKEAGKMDKEDDKEDGKMVIEGET